MKIDKNYQELLTFESYEDRFNYLKLSGNVGDDIFGENRRLNQFFYRSMEWRKVKNLVILRDNGLDLGCVGYDIVCRPIVHHMNPITIEDLLEFNRNVLDPNYLITVSVATHLAIHYGDERLIPRLSMDRERGDTKLW